MPAPEPEASIGRTMVMMGSSFAEMPLPAAGVVPDADTAKRIAEAVWSGRTSPATVRSNRRGECDTDSRSLDRHGISSTQ